MPWKGIKELTEREAAWVRLYTKNEATYIKETEDMSLIAKETVGTDFKQAPNGNHVGRCYQIIDIGTQHGEYLGEPTSRQQIIMRWELPYETEVFDGAEKPLVVSKFYTNSLSDKANLRRDLEAWRGKTFTPKELEGFNVVNVLGAACVVSVLQNEKGKATVKGVAALPKGTTCPPAFNAPSFFSIDDWSDEKYEALPKGFRTLIEQSDEYKAKFGKQPPKVPGDEFSTMGQRPDQDPNNGREIDDFNTPPF